MTKNLVEKYIDQQDLMIRAIQIACNRTFNYKVTVRWVAYVKYIGYQNNGVMCGYKDDGKLDSFNVSCFPTELLQEILMELTENVPNQSNHTVRDDNDLIKENIELRRLLGSMSNELNQMYIKLAQYKPATLVSHEYRDLIKNQI